MFGSVWYTTTGQLVDSVKLWWLFGSFQRRCGALNDHSGSMFSRWIDKEVELAGVTWTEAAVQPKLWALWMTHHSTRLDLGRNYRAMVRRPRTGRFLNIFDDWASPIYREVIFSPSRSGFLHPFSVAVDETRSGVGCLFCEQDHSVTDELRVLRTIHGPCAHRLNVIFRSRDKKPAIEW